MSTTTQRILVAVEDAMARTAIVENLRADSYEALAASGLGHAKSRVRDQLDALLVDLGPDTLNLIDAIRSSAVATADAGVPILAISSDQDRFHAIRLLERGADDVVYEPWLYLEVRARLAALLRRSSVDRQRRVLRAGALSVDVSARRAWIDGKQIKLTAREFDLLHVLATEPGRVFSRSELLERVWGLGDWARTRTLDSHAARLRRRLADAGGSGFVRTSRGRGYALVDA